MTKSGVLIYASNNGTTDYESMANWSADRIDRFLGLPTTIITRKAESGGSRRFDGETQPWLNTSRTEAWNDSPYDETIVLDADYIVNSDILLRLFDMRQDFLIHQHVSDATNRGNFAGQATFGESKFPQSWATVFYFNRDPWNEKILNSVKKIKANYKHFSDIYKFPDSPYRNDYAFSIALGLHDGHILGPMHSIPWPLATTSEDVRVSLEDDVTVLRYKNDRGKEMTNKISGLDIHVMNKQSMEAICAGS